MVGRRPKDDFANGRSYYGSSGKPLVVPADAVMQPAGEAVAWHREHVFLG